mmetsp:Transcript_56009/g.62629  ORF Transcript_56009/g.62629 Transcript_56009/m.62629 type:complete len:116 (-) Transcript_56009:109-456(-)
MNPSYSEYTNNTTMAVFHSIQQTSPAHTHTNIPPSHIHSTPLQYHTRTNNITNIPTPHTRKNEHNTKHPAYERYSAYTRSTTTTVVQYIIPTVCTCTVCMEAVPRVQNKYQSHNT